MRGELIKAARDRVGSTYGLTGLPDENAVKEAVQKLFLEDGHPDNFHFFAIKRDKNTNKIQAVRSTCVLFPQQVQN